MCSETIWLTFHEQKGHTGGTLGASSVQPSIAKRDGETQEKPRQKGPVVPDVQKERDAARASTARPHSGQKREVSITARDGAREVSNSSVGETRSAKLDKDRVTDEQRAQCLICESRQGRISQSKQESRARTESSSARSRERSRNSSRGAGHDAPSVKTRPSQESSSLRTHSGQARDCSNTNAAHHRTHDGPRQGGGCETMSVVMRAIGRLALVAMAEIDAKEVRVRAVECEGIKDRVESHCQLLM